MYSLYYSPGACSMAIHVALIECGVSFELKNVSITEGKNRDAEFLALNPRGSVPVLVDDGLVIREGGAQLVYLLDKHHSPLLPRDGKARAAALEWLMFANATLHPAYSRLFFLKKQNASPELMGAAVDAVNGLWKEVDARLAAAPYICGKECTMADILITVIANWSGNFPAIELGANCKRLFKEIIARPSYVKALASEQVTYKAAA